MTEVVDPAQEPIPDPTPEMVDENEVTSVAREVLAGLWGRGRSRRERLQAAGYDPAKVNEEVNKILKGS